MCCIGAPNLNEMIHKKLVSKLLFRLGRRRKTSASFKNKINISQITEPIFFKLGM